MANSVDPDQMPHYVASDLGVQCLLRSFCPNILQYVASDQGVQCFLGLSV